VVSSPDGDRWRVRRRWLNRGLPSLRKHVREAKEERDTIDGVAFADGGVGLIVGGVVLVAAIVLLPVLGIALELIVLAILFASGLIGRVLLGRPWTVEARNLDDGERSLAFGVKGFGAAGAAAEELASTISASGPPERLSAGERTALPRPTF
jgi:hypothetical protein